MTQPFWAEVCGGSYKIHLVVMEDADFAIAACGRVYKNTDTIPSDNNLERRCKRCMQRERLYADDHG